MSYTPGTKLSFKNGTECATVLTNNMVMATIVQGAPWRERMPLADWLILAEGEETVVPSDSEAIWAATIKKATADEAEAAAWANVSHAGAMWTAARERMDATTTQSELAAVQAAVSRAAAAASAAAAEAVRHTITYPERPVGTKLKWVDGESSSTVIVTKKGFLEVKRTPILYDRPKTSYASEEKWRATLPNMGAVTVTPPKPTLIQEKLAPLPEGLTDIEKMEELSKRFDYNPSFVIRPSQKMELENYDKSIEEMKETLALASGNRAFQIAGAINRLTSYTNTLREKLNGMTEEEQNFRTISIFCVNGGTSRIFIDIKGVSYLIGVYTHPNGEKCIVYDGCPWNLNAKTTQELGLTGLNKLSVNYRKTTYLIN